MGEFEHTFFKILQAAKRRERKQPIETRGRRRKPVRELQLGSTTAGRALLAPIVPRAEQTTLPRTWNIREIPPSHGHASRKGKSRTVRKSGQSGWR